MGPFANPMPLTSWSVVTRRVPAPNPYHLAAGRRAPRSAPVAPRGSGRSRLAGPQRRTRPEARTQAQRPFQGVAWGPEITPHYLWKLWVTRVFNGGRCALRALKRRRRGATLLGRARARQPPERSGRPDLRGGAVELSGHDDSFKPGHGRLALAAGQASSGGERNGRSPGFSPLLAGYDTSSRSPQPRASES